MAIKVLLPSLGQDPLAVDRFVHEARAVNQIQHPNLVEVLCFGRLVDGRAYYVMEWLVGERLADRLARTRLLQ